MTLKKKVHSPHCRGSVAATQKAAVDPVLHSCLGETDTKPIPPGASYLLEAEGFRPLLLVELPLFEVEHGFVHVDDAQLHLLLEGDELPLAWRFHPSKRIIDSRRGPVSPWSDGRLWKGRQNSAWQLPRWGVTDEWGEQGWSWAQEDASQKNNCM